MAPTLLSAEPSDRSIRGDERANASRPAQASSPPAKARDLRIDVFRGLALFIIAVEHMGGNWLTLILPMQFGWSSGADTFVLCSGIASALAFGGCYIKRGFWMGTLRIAQRVWQLYWAHLACFLATLACTLAISAWVGSDRFLAGMQHDFVVAHPREMLLALVTLRYLPPLSDILPMYLVLLAMVPAVMLARRLSLALPFLLVGGTYLFVWGVGVALPGNPITGSHWLFDPFGWQIVFFTGFFIAMGWVRLPPLGNRWIMTACAAVILLSVPVCWYVTRDAVPALKAIYLAVWPENGRTDYHVLRYIHLLACAYLAVSLVTARPALLNGVPAQVIALVGRQTLPVFLASVPLDVVGGAALDVWGNTPLMVLATTAVTWVLLLGVAFVAEYVKAKPWTKPGSEPPAEAKAAWGRLAATAKADPARQPIGAIVRGAAIQR